jgi:hypothetical protein
MESFSSTVTTPELHARFREGRQCRQRWRTRRASCAGHRAVAGIEEGSKRIAEIVGMSRNRLPDNILALK